MDKTRHFFVVLWLILICVAVTLTAYFISLAIYEQDGSKSTGCSILSDSNTKCSERIVEVVEVEDDFLSSAYANISSNSLASKARQIRS